MIYIALYAVSCVLAFFALAKLLREVASSDRNAKVWALILSPAWLFVFIGAVVAALGEFILRRFE